jgi:hypothetical protein
MGPLYLELRGAHMFSGAQRVAIGLLHVDSQQLGLAGCWQWGERLRGGPCVTLSGVHTHASIEGTTDPRDDAVLWALAGAAVNLSWILYAPLELHAEAGLELPIGGRPQFEVRGAGPVERASVLAGYGQLGVGVRIE